MRRHEQACNFSVPGSAFLPHRGFALPGFRHFGHHLRPALVELQSGCHLKARRPVPAARGESSAEAAGAGTMGTAHRRARGRVGGAACPACVAVAWSWIVGGAATSARVSRAGAIGAGPFPGEDAARFSGGAGAARQRPGAPAASARPARLPERDAPHRSGRSRLPDRQTGATRLRTPHSPRGRRAGPR